MTNNLKASLIIVNFNGFEITKNCLQSIFQNANGLDFEVIVVDNASSDRSAGKLTKLFGEKKNFFVLQRTKNDFLAAAYNDGFKSSRGKILLFMNNDLVVSKNWLSELLRAFEKKGIGMAGVSMLSYKRKNQIDNLGCKLNFLGYGQRIEAGKAFQAKSCLSEVFFVPGSVLAIRRELFEKAGGFDQSYGGNYEDVDLAWRIRLLGYKVLVAESAIVYHLGSWTVKKYLDKINSSFLCRRNRLTTILKNGGTAYLIIVLPIYLLAQTIIFLKEIFVDRNVQLATTTPRAIYYNLANLKSIMTQRKKIQALKKVADWQIIKKMSFV